MYTIVYLELKWIIKQNNVNLLLVVLRTGICGIPIHNRYVNVPITPTRTEINVLVTTPPNPSQNTGEVVEEPSTKMPIVMTVCIISS